jgi:hypothetical protein
VEGTELFVGTVTGVTIESRITCSVQKKVEIAVVIKLGIGSVSALIFKFS